MQKPDHLPTEAVTGAPDAGLVTIPSTHAPGPTLDRLEAVLRQEGIQVFARIDHAAGAATVGLVLRPTQVLLFGNPRAGTPLMQAGQTVGIDLPLKMLGWEDAAGKSWLTWSDPRHLAQRHGIFNCDGVVGAMTALLRELAAAATAPGEKGFQNRTRRVFRVTLIARFGRRFRNPNPPPGPGTSGSRGWSSGAAGATYSPGTASAPRPTPC